jgi:lipid II:glycine glycyltransferase (peptidoglycan interpeptide bridge formation enzyme)
LKFIKTDILNQPEEWKQFSEKIPTCEVSLAHNPDFAHIFSETFKLSPEYYLIYEDEKLVGGIPGFRQKQKFISMPVLSSAGISIIVNKYKNKEYYKDFLKQVGDNYEVRSFSKVTDYHYKDKVTCYLNLPDSADNLWNGFKSKLRSQIKKGFKNGLNAEIGNEELINDFYHLYSKNMHRVGTPVNSKNYFKSFLNNYRNGDAKIFIVKYNNKIVGVSITFSFGKFFEVMWASTDRDYNKLNTNMVLYWKMMEYSIKENMEIFSFGRSNKNSSSLKFKRQWGIQEYPLFFNYSTPRKNIREFRLFSQFWRKLPYQLTLILGPIIRKKVIN